MPGDPLELEIYGKRFRVRREGENWVVLIIGQEGKTRLSEDIFIPSVIREHEVRRYLEDLLHEYVPHAKQPDEADPYPEQECRKNGCLFGQPRVITSDPYPERVLSYFQFFHEIG